MFKRQPTQVIGRSAWAPRFRQKTYSWWIIIGNQLTGELLAMKRISQHSGQARHELSVDPPSVTGVYEWEMFIICDTICGLDVKKSLRFIV